MKPDSPDLSPDLSPDPNADGPRAWLSALADGDAQALDRACGHWRDDSAARQTWHAYHLIGDVMRSEELATSPGRDAAFLVGVRARLRNEAVVLAPTSVLLSSSSHAAPARRQAWLLPAAAVAGFVAVAAVLVVTRMGGPAATFGAPAMASASSPNGATNSITNGITLASQPSAVQSAPTLADNTGSAPAVIRDPRLDEFLRAHQSARGGMVVAAPGGTLRRVDVIVPAADR
jgi:sigma-E factor negative regulatory protein RseA